ncbi:zinc ribbon domain-containing protein [Kitasatospora sp. NPDC101155]|uniref:zinc ribbon domain-containing protein n=1 Tax=Kitasatospora sp. NPDC101155 TaxID=3364097 RepID=UPI00381E5EB9
MRSKPCAPTARAEFACRACGVMMHADYNSSRNIAARGAVAWTAGRQSCVPEPASRQLSDVGGHATASRALPTSRVP